MFTTWVNYKDEKQIAIFEHHNHKKYLMKQLQLLSYSILLTTLLLLTACTPTRQLTNSTDDGIIEFVFLHANDVYEIFALQGGKAGGLARVATLKDELLAENSNTLTVHAGDFLNPSLIGSIKYEGKRIKGKQMVEVMNAVGFDLITFGNHEFDLDEDDLQDRLNESRFEWISCNTFQKCGEHTFPFHREFDGRKHFVPNTYTWEIEDADGTKIKVGIFGITLPVNQKDYVHYDDFYKASKQAVKELSESTDVVIGLTHLQIEQDLKVAQQNQSVPLFMGGHDHDNMRHEVGNSIVAKADANAKTVYIHRLTYNKKTKACTLKSELITIDDSIAHHPRVAPVVDKWSKILMSNVGKIIDEPNKVIYYAEEPLDGRDISIRHQQTNLGTIIVKSFYLASKNVDAALMNSGSVRIDDQIQGDVTPLDFFRTLPFGGKIITVEMTGALLKRLLDASIAYKGKGAYLQVYKIEKGNDGKWLIANTPLDVNKNYNIAMSAFMLSGYDYSFFTLDKEMGKGIISVDEPDMNDANDKRRDLRLAIIDYLVNRK